MYTAGVLRCTIRKLERVQLWLHRDVSRCCQTRAEVFLSFTNVCRKINIKCYSALAAEFFPGEVITLWGTLWHHTHADFTTRRWFVLYTAVPPYMHYASIICITDGNEGLLYIIWPSISGGRFGLKIKSNILSFLNSIYGLVLFFNPSLAFFIFRWMHLSQVLE